MSLPVFPQDQIPERGKTGFSAKWAAFLSYFVAWVPLFNAKVSGLESELDSRAAVKFAELDQLDNAGVISSVIENENGNSAFGHTTIVDLGGWDDTKFYPVVIQANNSTTGLRDYKLRITRWHVEQPLPTPTDYMSVFSEFNVGAVFNSGLPNYLKILNYRYRYKFPIARAGIAQNTGVRAVFWVRGGYGYRFISDMEFDTPIQAHQVRADAGGGFMVEPLAAVDAVFGGGFIGDPADEPLLVSAP